MSWSWARSLRSAEQDLRMSEGFACSDLQTLQRFVPKKTCTSGLRWAEQGWERATAEAFLFLGTLCPFPTPGYRPGLALWGPGQRHSAGNPAGAAHLHQEAVSCVLAGSSSRALWTDSNAQVQPGGSAHSCFHRPRPNVVTQCRISLLSEF